MDADKATLIKALREEGGEFSAQKRALANQLESAGVENLHPALKSWIFDTIIGPMVKHPFVFQNIGGDAGLNVGNINKMYAWKIEIRRVYLNERNWWGYLMAHERPYRTIVLERLWQRKRITQTELRAVLIAIWTDTEMPQSNQETPVYLFHEAGFITDSAWRWAFMPDEIVCWRGVDGDLELTADGPSWTLDRKCAEMFADRYRPKNSGDLYRYVAKKSEALAFITQRGETEIILDFDGDSERSRIEHISR
jgi:hypothetical protein